MSDSSRGHGTDVLLTEAIDGSQEAFGKLLELYRNYLALLARTHIDSCLLRRASPSDLVQETFLEAHRDFVGFRGDTGAEFVAWLRRILLRNLASLVEKQLSARRRSVRREVSLQHRLLDLENSSYRLEEALVSSVSSPSVQAQRHEIAAVLANHLAVLPAQYREVLVLRNLEGLTFEEVAQRMGRSAGAVRMLWMRALRHLRQGLKRENLI